jgi:REP element-mobilizing transposase RayT
VGACYAITIVTHGRDACFVDAVRARPVMAELASNAAAESLAWVVMPDHVHWLFKLRSGSLSHCVQAMKSRCTRLYRGISGSRTPLWQAGFYDHRLRCDEDLIAQARYIVSNPLRRGLANRIEDYPFWWCRWIAGSSDL